VPLPSRRRVSSPVRRPLPLGCHERRIPGRPEHKAAVTVTSVRKDPDGSYDVLGTKAGTQLMYDVSGDLTTFTQHAPGTRGGK
jgi:hypothetical protein